VIGAFDQKELSCERVVDGLVRRVEVAMVASQDRGLLRCDVN